MKMKNKTKNRTHRVLLKPDIWTCYQQHHLHQLRPESEVFWRPH